MATLKLGHKDDTGIKLLQATDDAQIKQLEAPKSPQLKELSELTRILENELTTREEFLKLKKEIISS